MARRNRRLEAAERAKSQSGPLGYVKNVVKEVKDNVKAYQRTGEMSNRVGPGTDEAANRLRRKEDKEFGQLMGAVLQGRRYDANGKQIKAPARQTGTIKPMPKKKK